MNIFITWVSSWIGRNLLEKYTESGNKVYGVVRTQKQKEEIQEEFSKTKIYVCDLSDVVMVSNYLKNDIVKNTKIVFISSIVWSMPIKNLSVKTPMHTKSGMDNMKWRNLEKVSHKIIQYIEIKQWIRHMYLDWWLIAKLWNIIK